MAISRSLEFLPDFLQTPANKRFLSSTLDQLISEPAVRKFNGYVGRQFAPVYRNGDNYIQEIDSQRQNYQLEPAIVVKNLNNRVDFYSSYTDLLQQISFYGGITDNHNRLFGNQSYTYNSNYDFDKLVNFSNYYWLPSGPAAVSVGIGFIPNNQDYVISIDTNRQVYNVDLVSGNNPEIVLRRDGLYKFNVNNVGNNLWIQSEPTTNGFSATNNNLSVRLSIQQGVTNNGEDQGVVIFDVPSKTQQDSFLSMPLGFEADLATSLRYADIANRNLSDVLADFGSLGGYTGDLENKYIVFVNQTNNDGDWTSQAAPVPLDILYPGQLVDTTNRGDVYKINLVDNGSDQVIVLTAQYSTPINTRILVKSGSSSGLLFYKAGVDTVLTSFPLITANLDTLYYVSDSTPGLFGKIKLVDLDTDYIDIDTEILGQIEYISPNGVKFTNGLKVTFDSSVLPVGYQNQTYYVEGVGTGIKLVAASGSYSDIEYFTINRASRDGNDWSQGNRWFHEEVIRLTAQYNNVTPLFNQDQRARRPIIEFNADLQLFDHGREYISSVNYIDYSITDAFGTATEIIFAGSTSFSFQGETLQSGDTIVFAGDQDIDVRQTVYEIIIVELDGTDTLLLLPQTTILEFQNIKVIDGTYSGKNYYFVNQEWNEGQNKQSVNQYPLFDIVDENAVSFSEKNLSNFAGTKIFSYRPGTGTNDPVLGFPLRYKNINNLGDIEFENNYQIDTYRYSVGQTFTTEHINRGFLVKNLSRTQQQKLNVWTKTEARSQQYQQFTRIGDGNTNQYVFNLTPINLLISKAEVKVYLNNVLQNSNQYQLTVTDVVEISFTDNLPVDTRLDVLILSDQVDSTGFFQIPTNLENNSLNSEFEYLTLGQLRNHAREIFSSHKDLKGLELGSNNSRDLDYKLLPGTILQHSSPVIYAGLFLTHPDANFVDSIYYAQREYSKFKNRFLELAKKINYQDAESIPDYVDEIISVITSSKSVDSPWYYSDMVPNGADNEIYEYEVLDIDATNYLISSIFNNLVASNRAILVYLNGSLLTLGKDYEFSQTVPAVILKQSLARQLGDIIRIVEYNNTDGNYIPETPTKLGLWPKFTPAILVDDRYNEPQTVIQGHDGSITIAFGDFRDSLLLELEKRIYNNIKTEYDIENRDVLWDVIPGKFRDNDYTAAEFVEIYSRSFLKWVGGNQLDYITNSYFASNSPKTWNYSRSSSIIDNEPLPGNYRAIYRYLYDTDRPHSHPWEMLGFSEQPSWWEDYYGPAPYTGGNLVLWGDLETGTIRGGLRQGVDTRFARPGLLSIIPVDQYGDLRTPDQFLLKNFNGNETSSPWAIGDSGPVETAWRCSSDFPFAMQIAMALARPADYFGLLLDNHRYVYNSDLDQNLISGSNDRIKNSNIVLNGLSDSGEITRAAGYTNYIVDYLTSQGRNGLNFIRELLNNIDVRLSYKMAGFSDKKLLKIFAEQTSPGSINDSILVPEENYQLYLHKSTPNRRAVYSSIIIRRTGNGYAVEGYDYNNPFFTIVPSINNGNYIQIKGIEKIARIYKDFQLVFLTIPYGFEFNTRQQVVDFIISYQRYLNSMGFVFTEFNTDLRQPQNFELSATEFLTWSEQGWGQDSILVLSPAIGKLNLNDSASVVDEITGKVTGSRLLDQNFSALTGKDFSVVRDNDSFELETVNARIIGLADLSLVQYEHVLILDNLTQFDDVIYDPSLGSRQYRLKLIGQKTANWNGRLSAPGFIYNDGLINEWQLNRDYNKGDLVSYKNRIYSALDFVPGSDTFDFADWQLNTTANTDPSLLLNFASNAKKFVSIYDVDRDYYDVNLENYSNSIIGFKPRDYFNDFVLENKSQVKFYQGFIKEKGTKGAVNALVNATFNKLEGNIDYYEDWAIRVGTYGHANNLLSTEIVLEEKPGTSNPFGLEVITTDDQPTPEFRSIYESELFVSGLNRNRNLFVDRNTETGIYDQDLITAGFVDPTEVDLQIFDINVAQQQIQSSISQIGTGVKIWTARDYTGVWNVYRTTATKITVTKIEYGLDNTAEITTQTNSNLQPGEIIIIKDFDPVLDGVYQILIKDSLKTFTVSASSTQVAYLEDAVTVEGSGIIFKLDSAKVDRITKIDNKSNWKNGELVYVNDENNWQVYEKSQTWNWQKRFTTEQNDSNWGSSVSVDPGQNMLIIGAPTAVSPTVEYYNISGPNPYKFVINPQVSGSTGFGSAVDQSERKLYVGAPGYSSSRGYLAVYNQIGTTYNLDQVIPGVGSGDLFGTSVTSSNDNRWLYVGAPGEEKVYAYKLINLSRQIDSLVGNGTTGPFTLSFTPESVQSLRVYNGSTWLVSGIDYTVAGNQITFAAVTSGTYVYYQSSYYKYVDYVELAAPSGADNFGQQIKCTTDGRQLAVSAPGHSNQGRVFVFDRTVEAFDSIQGQTSFTALRSLIEYDVLLNGVRQVAVTDYSNPAGNTVLFTRTLNRGDKVEIETNDFLLISSLAGAFPQNNSNFGYSIDFCNSNCSLFIGQPDYQETNYLRGIVTRYVNQGRVEGETISGAISTPNNCITAGDSLRLNNYEIYFDNQPADIALGYPTLDYVVAKINAAGLSGITASKVVEVNPHTLVTEYKLKIATDSQLVENKLRIGAGFGTALSSLSLNVFAVAQTITKPDSALVENFGKQVRINKNSNSLVVGSRSAYLTYTTSFDSAETTFDQDSTPLKDRINRSGTVYVYDLVSDQSQYQNVPIWQPNQMYLKDQLFTYQGRVYVVRESFTSGTNFENTVKLFSQISGNHFVYVQELVPSQILGSGSDFGMSIVYTNTLAVVLSKSLTQGRADIFRNPSASVSWNVKRSQTPIVDLNSVAGLSLYNKRTNVLVTRLDYVDPLRGKVLGVADQTIDLKVAGDPAVYNTINNESVTQPGKYFWADQFVGRVWWDLDDVRYIEYQQKDKEFKFDRWGELFPGSQISVYEWVESPVLPSQYQSRGFNGVPKNPDDSFYTQVVSVDTQTGLLRTRYYFWVKNKTTAAYGKNVSISSIANVIQYPTQQNIPYVTILDKNSLSLYNCSQFLSGGDIVLRINSFETAKDLPVHNQWKLVQQTNDVVLPEFLLNKIIDSLLGNQSINGVLKTVPDPALPDNLKYGIGIRPRQSVFKDRLKASQIFIDYINRELSKVIIVGRRELTTMTDQEPLPDATEYDYDFNSLEELVTVNLTLLANGTKLFILNDINLNNKWSIYTVNNGVLSLTDFQSYKLENYWQYIDWYAADFDSRTIPDVIVDTFDRIDPAGVQTGQIVKVKNTGNATWGIYRKTDIGLTPLGLQNATIRLNSILYDPVAAGIGFDVLKFDTGAFDQNPGNDFRLIFDALRNDIAVDDYAYIFTGAIFALFEYVFHEQDNPDWIFKTSFIDIVHKLRKLIQYPSYVRDNQDYYRQYIEEVKPYKTKIRQYLLNYNGQDDAELDVTDFDFPVFYDVEQGRYRHPVPAVDTDLMQTSPWNSWAANNSFSLDTVSIIRSGIFYQVEPTLIPVGGDGTARLRSTVNNGPITSVTVVNGGSGFYSNPEIQAIPSPNPDGSLGRNAILLGRVVNRKVRTSTVTLKFDRIEYSGNIQDWAASRQYRANDFFINTDKIYLVLTDFTSGLTFEQPGSGLGINYKLATSADLNSAMKRAKYYYIPNSTMTPNDLRLLFSGIDYPGVKVKSHSFFTTTSATSAMINDDAQILIFELDDKISVIPNQYVLISADSLNYIKGTVLSYDIENDTLEIGVLDRVGTGTYTSWTVENIELDDEEDIDIEGFEQPDLRNLDVIYRSQFIDTSLGTKAEDINVHGGRFIDTVNSHAPEELVPGRIYDTLEIRVFTKKIDDTHIGFRLFYNMNTNLEDANLNPDPTVEIIEPMTDSSTSVRVRVYDEYALMRPIIALGQTLSIVINGEYMTYNAYNPVTQTISGLARGQNNTIARAHAVGSFVTVLNQMKNTREYYRISGANTTRLSAALSNTDLTISLLNASVLPRPSATDNRPGVVFINGEKILYWTIDYINNQLGQLVRGVHGTGIATTHAVNSLVSDASADQVIAEGDVVVWSDPATKLEDSTTEQAGFLLNSLSYNP